MPRKPKKKTITKGVYADKSGVAIRISIHGKAREFRKDAEGVRYTESSGGPGWYREERARVHARERLKVPRHADAANIVPLDIQRFLETIHSPSHRRNARSYLKRFSEAFKQYGRNDITPVELKQHFASIDKADSTKRHIRDTLIDFYETLNGVHGYNPARDLPRPPKAHAEARAIPYRVIEKIFAALQPSASKARLMVMAYTGLPQHLIAKLQPADLHLDKREVIVRPRRKGAGVEGRALPLSKAGVAAFKAFIACHAFGSFQNKQLVNTFEHGVTLSGVSLRDDARPYDLRHSFLTEVYRQTGDLHAVSELGMHATLEQTARYTKGSASERATKAIRAVPRFFTMRLVGVKRKQRESRGQTVQSKKHKKGRGKR